MPPTMDSLSSTVDWYLKCKGGLNRSIVITSLNITSVVIVTIYVIIVLRDVLITRVVIITIYVKIVL